MSENKTAARDSNDTRALEGDEQAMWRNWDPRLGPWLGSPPPAVVHDGGRFFPSFTLDTFGTGYYSDDSDDYVLAEGNMRHLHLDDPPDQDTWRKDYLEFVIAQRSCSARREAAGLAPASCTRSAPCDDCIFHPGAAATSVHWQFMDDARLQVELDAYKLERAPAEPDWAPPSPTSERRRLQPPRLLFGVGNPASPRVEHDTQSNHASPSSSVRSDPPSPTHCGADGLPNAARPVFGPPRPPPAYEDLSD